MAIPTVSAGVKFTTALSAAGITALIAGLKEIIDVSAAFEAQMSRVAAVSSAAGDELLSLSTRARELGSDTIFTATQAGRGMEELSRLGLTVQQIFVVVQDTLNLAASSALEMGRAAQITAGGLKSFNLEATEAGKITDILAITAASTGANVDNLGESLAKGGAIANTAGLSFGEFNAFIGVLGDRLIKGAEAGTGFRQFLAGLIKQSDAGAIALNKLGLSAEDIDIASRGLLPVIRTLADAFEKVEDRTTKVSLAADIWGKRQFNSALVAIDSADKIEELVKAYKNGEGAALRMAEVMNNNLAGAFKLLTSASQEVALQLGDELGPNIRDLVDDMTSAARATTESGESLKSVGDVLGTVITFLNVAIKSLGVIALGLETGFAKIVAVNLDGLSKIQGVMADAAETLGLTDLAQEYRTASDVNAAAAQEFFGRFQGDIDLIGELALSIRDDWNLVREQWKTGAESVAEVDLQPVNDQIRQTFESLRATLGEGGQSIEEEVETLRNVIDLRNIFEGIDVADLTDKQTENLKKSLDAMIKLFNSAGFELNEGILRFRASLDFVPEGLSGAADAVDDGADQLENALQNLGGVIDSSGNVITAGAKKVKSAIIDILGFDKEAILENAAALESALKSIGETEIRLDPEQGARLKEQIQEVIDEFKTIKEDVPPLIRQAAQSFGIYVQSFGEVGQAARSARDSVVGSLEGITGATDTTSEVVGELGGTFTSMAAQVEDAAQRSTRVVREIDSVTGETVTSIVAFNREWSESQVELATQYETTKEKADDFAISQDDVADKTSRGKEEIEGVSEAAQNASTNLGTAAEASITMAESGKSLEGSLSGSSSLLGELSDKSSGLVESFGKLSGIVIAPSVDTSSVDAFIGKIDMALAKLTELEDRA